MAIDSIHARHPVARDVSAARPSTAGARDGPKRPGSAARGVAFLRVLEEGMARAHPPSLRPARPPPAARPPPPVRAAMAAGPRTGVGTLVERTMGVERHIDAMVAAAARGRTFSASELLGLQATVFRYSQTIDVLSHTAERLLGALKQTLGTQL